MHKPYKYLFGPVPSRRLGRSLGIDLVDAKICSYNCIYCQIGRTVHHTIERREWVPTADVIDELRDWAASGEEADTITLAGQGEPTLHSGFGDVIEAARSLTGLRTVLLTNGSLLHLPDVRRAAAQADVVKVTLSTVDESVWRRLHRPEPHLHLAETVLGLRALRVGYEGEIWIEVMVITGLNDTPESLQPLAALFAEVKPDRIQLNTAVRPPVESDVEAVGRPHLEALAVLFDPPAEVIGERKATGGKKPDCDAIMEMIRRHPCSIPDLELIYLGESDELVNCLKALEKSGSIRREQRNGRVFIIAVEQGQ